MANRFIGKGIKIMKVYRKCIDIKETDWAKLKQLAINHEVTLREEVDQIIGAFLDCSENLELGKEK